MSYVIDIPYDLGLVTWMKYPLTVQVPGLYSLHIREYLCFGGTRGKILHWVPPQLPTVANIVAVWTPD